MIRADNPAEFVAAFTRLKRILLGDGYPLESTDILVEDFIPGVEVALEGLLTNGVLRTLALFDKPDPLDGPFFEETIYITPSRLPEDDPARHRELRRGGGRSMVCATGRCMPSCGSTSAGRGWSRSPGAPSAASARPFWSSAQGCRWKS